MSFKQLLTEILKETQKDFIEQTNWLRKLKLIEVVLFVAMAATLGFMYHSGQQTPRYGTLTETEVELKHFELQSLIEAFMQDMQDPDEVRFVNKTSVVWMDINYVYENPSAEFIQQVISNIEEQKYWQTLSLENYMYESSIKEYCYDQYYTRLSQHEKWFTVTVGWETASYDYCYQHPNYKESVN